MLTTPEYAEPRTMTYKEFVKSDLCKKMVREEIDKDMMLQLENSENMKKSWCYIKHVILKRYSNLKIWSGVFYNFAHSA